MNSKHPIIKINLPGGMVSAGDLLAILHAADQAEVEAIQFGNRQEILFPVAPGRRQALVQALSAARIQWELHADAHPNIISSYVTEEVFNQATWLREGVYKDILDLFDYRPRLKINLVDQAQTFIPFFTGNLNFIASDTPNYWYLYLRFPKTNCLYCWPHLIYSEDIPALSSVVEQVIFANQEQFYDQPASDGAQLYALVSASRAFVAQPVASPLRLPTFLLPYYEGFNRYDNKWWLGLYRRDELFPVAFLQDVARICLKTRIGQLYTTPWKSLLIKNIDLATRPLWDEVLSRHRINVRHAANELNWQVEDLCEYGLTLKNYLVRQFNEEDIRTYQLCFAIKTKPKTGLFGSIVIRTQPPEGFGLTGLHEEQFEILHTRDFNPNSKDFISFRKRVSRDQLSWYLIQLCHQFYERQHEASQTLLQGLYPEEPAALVPPVPATTVYQCPHCLTAYDETYGDPEQRIAPGTPFTALAGYQCPTCEAPQKEFRKVAGLADAIA